ncbi:MAG: hypothetical protein ABWX73_13135 [Marmoricola sp.]
MSSTAQVLFCGETYVLSPGHPLSLGRVADVVLDEDNPYLHRRFLAMSMGAGLVWIENIGSQLSATLADEHGLVQTWLAPGAKVPVVFPRSVVFFTAGPTTYEFEILVEDPPFTTAAPDQVTVDSTTLGRVTLTPDQKMLCLVLSEAILRRGASGRGQIPPSARAAERLGWTTTKFNRKLDNVCEKLARLGVRGLTPAPGQPASGRRARLVEYVLASRLLVEDDLALLAEVDQAARRQHPQRPS